MGFLCVCFPSSDTSEWGHQANQEWTGCYSVIGYLTEDTGKTFGVKWESWLRGAWTYLEDLKDCGETKWHQVTLHWQFLEQESWEREMDR